MRKPFPSDLTDEQWGIIQPLIPVHRVGRPREVDMREVVNSIFSLWPGRSEAGCAVLGFVHSGPRAEAGRVTLDLVQGVLDRFAGVIPPPGKALDSRQASKETRRSSGTQDWCRREDLPHNATALYLHTGDRVFAPTAGRARRARPATREGSLAGPSLAGRPGALRDP